jgi:hypothetical protein
VPDTVPEESAERKSKRRIHAEEGHRKKQDRERREQAAGLDVVHPGEHQLEQFLGEQRQQQQIGGADQHRYAEHSGRRLAVREPAADEIAGRQRRQHGRDQRRPGVDAAAEIGVEVARAQHLETHHDRAGDEGDQIDHAGRGTCARAGCFEGVSLHHWLLGL